MSELAEDEELQQRLLGAGAYEDPATWTSELERPLALRLVPVVLVVLVGLPFIGSPSTWVTLTVAGLAMGMIIFIIASGLTLVFGLMDVLNFGHGVFIALGAFVATSVLGAMGDWAGLRSLWRNLLAVLPAMLVAMLVAGAIGLGLRARSSCGRSTAST